MMNHVIILYLVNLNQLHCLGLCGQTCTYTIISDHKIGTKHYTFVQVQTQAINYINFSINIAHIFVCTYSFRKYSEINKFLMHECLLLLAVDYIYWLVVISDLVVVYYCCSSIKSLIWILVLFLQGVYQSLGFC